MYSNVQEAAMTERFRSLWVLGVPQLQSRVLSRFRVRGLSPEGSWSVRKLACT